MSEQTLIEEYNHENWLGPGQNIYPASFAKSPPLGKRVADVPLWHLEGEQTSLSALWQAHDFTVVEFGSFT